MDRNIGKTDKQIRLLFVLVVAILGELKLITYWLLYQLLLLLLYC